MLLNSQNLPVNTMPMESSQLRERTDWLGCFNQRLLDTIPDAVYLYDLVDQRNIFSSRSIADLLGYTEPEIEAMQDIGLAHLIHPEDLEAVADHFQSFTILPLGKVIEMVYRMKRADGEWSWLRSREISFLQAIDGYPLQIFGTVQVFTQASQLKQLWQSAQAPFCKSFPPEINQIKEMVMITDRQGVIKFVNQKFEQITGYTRTDAIGKTPSLLQSGQHSPDFYQHLWNTIESGNVFRGAFINRRKSGELFHEDKTIVPIKNGQGSITHFLSIGQDVTEYWQI